MRSENEVNRWYKKDHLCIIRYALFDRFTVLMRFVHIILMLRVCVLFHDKSVCRVSQNEGKFNTNSPQIVVLVGIGHLYPAQILGKKKILTI